jgi:hypothetical protein
VDRQDVAGIVAILRAAPEHSNDPRPGARRA